MMEWLEQPVEMVEVETNENSRGIAWGAIGGAAITCIGAGALCASLCIID